MMCTLVSQFNIFLRNSFRVLIVISFLVGYISAETPKNASGAGESRSFIPILYRSYNRPPLVIWADSKMTPVLRSFAPAFKIAYQADLIVVEKTWIVDDFISAVQNGAGPDLIFVVSEDAVKLVNNHLVAPIDIGELKARLLPQALADFTFSGKLFGAPLYIDNLALFYNRALVPEPPKTWDELFDVGMQLVNANFVAYCLAFSDLTYHTQPFLSAYGGYIFGTDNQGDYNRLDLGLDSSGAITATTKLVSEVNKGCMSPIKGWDTTHIQFQTAQTAFLITGPWALNRLRSSEMPYGIADIPGGGKPWVESAGLLLNKKAPNRYLAITFINEFLLTDPGMAKISVAADRPSAWNLPGDLLHDQDLAAIRRVAEKGVPLPNLAELELVWAPWNAAMTAIYATTQTPQEALQSAAAKIRADIARAGKVNVVGTYQDEVGCGGTWLADCAATSMNRAPDSPHWDSGPFNLPAGEYSVLVAVGDSLATNYGQQGQLFGSVIPFSLSAPGAVSFSWDPFTHILTIIK